jgi:hypothetical protein
LATFTLQKDPRIYARGVAKKAVDRCRILGLDLGTNCGAAFCDIIPGIPQEQVRSYLELWDLSIGPWDTRMLQVLRMRQFLTAVDPDVIVFEDVRYTPPQEMMQKGVAAVLARAATSMEFFGMLKTTVAFWAAENDVPAQGIGIKEIKAFAMREAAIVKKGVANKEDMIGFCNKVFGTSYEIETYEKTGADNIADAGFVMLMGVRAYSDALSVPFAVGDPEPKPSPKREKKHGVAATKKKKSAAKPTDS